MVPLISGAEPSVSLCGSGLAPSDDDVTLWLDHIAPRMDELIEAAGIRLKSAASVAGMGDTIELSPRRVVFRERGEIGILFDSEPQSDSGESPIATYSADLKLLDVDWWM
jgi:hypothetical protein